MALSVGTGYNQPKNPPKSPPHPAPASPHSGVSPFMAGALGMAQNPQARAALSYGYDPVQAMTSSASGVPSSYMPTPMGISGADLLAQYQRKASGYRRSFGYGTDEESANDIAMLMSFLPGGGAGMGPKAPGFIARMLSSFKRGSGAERAASYPTGQAANSLGNLGQHADLAEATIANKLFDQTLGTSKRASDLKKAPSLGDILKEDTLGRQSFVKEQLGVPERPMLNPGPQKGFMDSHLENGIWGSPSTRDHTRMQIGLKGEARSDQNVKGFEDLMQNLAPLWQHGEGSPGDYLGAARGAEHPDNMRFDFLNEGGPMFDRLPEGPMPPKVSRQQKNANGYQAAKDALFEQKQAEMVDPFIRAQGFFGKAFGRMPAGPEYAQHIPELEQLINLTRHTNTMAGGQGFVREEHNTARNYGMGTGYNVPDLQAYLRKMLRGVR
jgi:hypothetical protein